MRPAPPRRTLEIRLKHLSQLFNSLDPSPFIEKDLDPNAEQFILDWAVEPARGSPEFTLSLLLEMHDPRSDPPAGVAAAVQNFFLAQARTERARLRQLIRDGQISLMIGVSFITACTTLASLLSEARAEDRFVQALAESLIVAGWVGMWRPIQIGLYDWWPIRRRISVLDRLGRARVELSILESSSQPAH